MKLNITWEDIEKGVPQDVDACPIALAIERETGELAHVMGAWCGTYDDASNGDFYQRTYRLSTEAREFIYRFDEGLGVEPFEARLLPIDPNSRFHMV